MVNFTIGSYIVIEDGTDLRRITDSGGNIKYTVDAGTLFSPDQILPIIKNRSCIGFGKISSVILNSNSTTVIFRMATKLDANSADAKGIYLAYLTSQGFDSTTPAVGIGSGNKTFRTGRATPFNSFYSDDDFEESGLTAEDFEKFIR